MVTVFHYTPVNAEQFDRLNSDSLAGKCQKRQNFIPSEFCAILYLNVLKSGHLSTSNQKHLQHLDANGITVHPYKLLLSMIVTHPEHLKQLIYWTKAGSTAYFVWNIEQRHTRYGVYSVEACIMYTQCFSNRNFSKNQLSYFENIF